MILMVESFVKGCTILLSSVQQYSVGKVLRDLLDLTEEDSEDWAGD